MKCVSIPVFVDKEPGITNAIRKVVPSASALHCWNHIKQDFKFWLGKQKVSSDQKSVYISDLDMTLDSDLEDIFMENCENLTAKWSKPVVDCFNKNIRDDIVKYSAKWKLKELNLSNPYSGITNNSSEGTVIKRLMKWKEVPLDTAVLCLSYLQIIIGMRFCGDFVILETFPLDQILAI